MYICPLFNLSITTLTKHEKIYLINITPTCAIMLVLLPIFIVLSLPLASAQTSIISRNGFEVFPPDSKPYNSTYGEWSAKWWKWALSIPADTNPLIDQTGENCAVNQSAPVWFLTGTQGGPAERRCVVPEGMSIFFPIINAYASYVENPLVKTESELRALLKSPFDQVRVAEATVDAVKLENLVNYRVQSPLFNFTYPENNIGGVPPGPSQAVAEGYWVMLHPLAAGDHTIHFRGGIVDPTVTGAINFVTDVTYHLTISNSTTIQTAASTGGNTTNTAITTADAAN
jgi:hypothetical protein